MNLVGLSNQRLPVWLAKSGQGKDWAYISSKEFSQNLGFQLSQRWLHWFLSAWGYHLYIQIQGYNLFLSASPRNQWKFSMVDSFGWGWQNTPMYTLTTNKEAVDGWRAPEKTIKFQNSLWHTTGHEAKLNKFSDRERTLIVQHHDSWRQSLTSHQRKPSNLYLWLLEYSLEILVSHLIHIQFMVLDGWLRFMFGSAKILQHLQNQWDLNAKPNKVQA